jgi:hypothetical protein
LKLAIFIGRSHRLASTLPPQPLCSPIEEPHTPRGNGDRAAPSHDVRATSLATFTSFGLEGDHGAAGACAERRSEIASASVTETDPDRLGLLPDCRLSSFHRFCDPDYRRPRVRVRLEFTQIFLTPWCPSESLLFRHKIRSLSTG